MDELSKEWTELNPMETFNKISEGPVDANILSSLALSDCWFIRQAVAYHPNTQPEVLTKLSTDDHYLVRSSVAINGNTTKEVINSLKNDSHEIVIDYAKDYRDDFLRLVKQQNEFFAVRHPGIWSWPSSWCRLRKIVLNTIKEKDPDFTTTHGI